MSGASSLTGADDRAAGIHRATSPGIIGGYFLDLLSMPLLRQRPLFLSAHFFFGTLAMPLFVGGGYTGWRLKQRTESYADVRNIHGFLAYLGLFIALAVAVTRFILLP